MKRCLLTFITLISSVLVGFTQNSLNQYYEIDNFHSKELIKAVVRDNDGYLWIATDEGVLRYDGKETLVYQGLVSPYVKDYLITRKNEIIVIHDTGIEKIISKDDSIHTKKSQMNSNLSYPKSIFEDSDSAIWIGEMEAIVKIKDGKMERFELGSDYLSISYHRSFSFAEDAFGHLWAAPFKGKLLSYDKKAHRFQAVDIGVSLSEVSSIVSIRGDHLLIGGKEGIVQVKIDSKKDILEVQKVTDIENVSDMESIDSDNVYISTWNSGLFYWNFNHQRPNIQAVEDVNILDIVNLSYNARNRELWIAGAERIGVLKSTQVISLERNGRSRIESMTLDDKGGYYFSTGEQVFYCDQIIGGHVTRLLRSSETYYGRILYAHDKLFVGDFYGLVYTFDPKTNQKVVYVEASNNIITSLFEDKSFNIWVTGSHKGVIRIDHLDRAKIYPEVRSSTTIKQSATGLIISAGSDPSQSLSIYDEKNDKFNALELHFDVGVPNNLIINDIKFDDNNRLWLATSFGLFRCDEKDNYKNAIRISVLESSDNELIRSIEISNQFIWLAYRDVLVLFDGKESLLFNKDSGLPSNIIKERGLQYGPGGHLYINTAKGLASIDEKEIQFRKSKMPIFKSLAVNGETVNTDIDELEFNYKSRLECHFLTLSFPNTKLQYQSRVIGYDDRWSASSTNTNLSILGFSEGNYTLQIRSKMGGYLWSDPLSYRFVISKPWYREWWSIVLFVLVVGLIVLVFVQIHNRNLIQQKKKLQKIIEKRTEEIQNQKNEIIAQQEYLIKQKEELLQKNEMIHETEKSRNKADLNFLHLKEKQLQEQIEYKNKQITTHALNILQKNESLKEIREDIQSILKKPEKNTLAELRKTLNLIDGSFKLDKDWDDFKLYFEQIYTGFYAKLKVNFPDITNLEMRHCALIRLNLPTSECASILGISQDSIKVSRSRLRKKLELNTNQSLTEFIMGL